MSYNYDAQLIDSVKVGQARIEGALLFGSDRLKRQYKRRIGTFIVSFFLAVLGAAGCVLAGWIISLLANYQAQQQGRQQQWQQTEPAVDPSSEASFEEPSPAVDPLTDPSALPPDDTEAEPVIQEN